MQLTHPLATTDADTYLNCVWGLILEALVQLVHEGAMMVWYRHALQHEGWQLFDGPQVHTHGGTWLHPHLDGGR